MPHTTRTFTAAADDGRKFTIVVITNIEEIQSLDAIVRKEGHRVFRTRDNARVTRVDKGIYIVHDDDYGDIRVTTDSPDAV